MQSKNPAACHSFAAAGEPNAVIPTIPIFPFSSFKMLRGRLWQIGETLVADKYSRLSHLKMMMFCVYVLAALLCSWSCVFSAPVDNIEGTYQVRKNLHYSNKTTLTWGENSAKIWNVTVSLSSSTATYDCSNTTSYMCPDPSWIYDYNKLWGKSRCGYAHGHHIDSDRFVWRR